MVRRLLQWFFHHLYTDLAWAYDLVAWVASGGLWYEWTFVAEQFIREEPVLEVGVGRGRLLKRLLDHGHQAVGIELSTQMVQAAQTMVGTSGQPAPLTRGDGRLLPFPANRFGAIVTTFPAPYVTEVETQREFARVLRTGGRWIWVDRPSPRTPTVRMGVYSAFRLLRLVDTPTANRVSQLSFIPAFAVTVEEVSVGPSNVEVVVLQKRSPPDER